MSGGIKMTTGKRQPPLWLDMDFMEALSRFAGADPKEAAEAEALTASKRKAEQTDAPPSPPTKDKLEKRDRPRKQSAPKTD